MRAHEALAGMEGPRWQDGTRRAAGLGLGVIGGTLPAVAGSDDGNVQVRVLATVVDPDTDATVTGRRP